LRGGGGATKSIPEIALRDLDKSNWLACTKISVTEAQQRLFPFPVVYWIAESKLETSFRPVAVYTGGQPVGFAVYGQDPDDNSYWILALVIDQHHQRQGYGRAATLALIDLIRREHGVDRIMIGHRQKNYPACNLYEQLGFRKVGEHRLADGEIEEVRCLALGAVAPQGDPTMD
jgi:diamine N-acetyltransferase